MAKHNEKRPPSNRQLKVGEEIRHSLSEAFMRAEFFNPVISAVPITVSEVRISPDLKNAMAFVMPLGGNNAENVLKELEKMAPYFRTVVSNKINMKFSPRISFKLDRTYEYAHKMEELLNKPEVRRDLDNSIIRNFDDSK